MALSLLLPLLIGTVAILQGAFNRLMSDSIGLTWTVIYGNIFTFALAIIAYFIIKANPELVPDFIRVKQLFLFLIIDLC